jgi:hypothetical protein
MDGLVKEGVKLMRHYVHAECTPSRVSFQTGRVRACDGVDLAHSSSAGDLLYFLFLDHSTYGVIRSTM